MSDNYFGFDLHERRTLEALGVTPANADLATQVANLNTWVTTFVTKLNADFTAQNAAVAASQLDVDYDADPQA